MNTKLIIIAAGSTVIALSVIISEPIKLSTNQLVASVMSGQGTLYRNCLNAIKTNYPGTDASDWEGSEVNLDNTGGDDYIFKLSDDDLCGSGGCIFELCLANGAEATPVHFGYVGRALTPLSTVTNNLRDLQLHGQSTSVLAYDGQTYQLTATD